jgi:hypothetical protein
MPTSLIPLLYYDPKYSDESIPDYIDRLTFWNRFKDTKKFEKILMNIYNSRFEKEAMEDVGARYFECKSNNFKTKRWFKCRRALELLLKRNISIEEMNLHPSLQQPSVDNRWLTFCPTCWKEKKYIRYYWRDISYTECHKHKEPLKYVLEYNYSKASKVIYRKGENKEYFEYSSDTTNKMYSNLENLTDGMFTYNSAMRLIGHMLLESKCWGKVIDVLKRFFGIECKYGDPIWDSYFKDNEIILTSRLDYSLESLYSKNSENKKLINIVTVIVFSQVHGYWGDIYYRACPNFHNWLMDLAYSVSPSFHSYLTGEQDHELRRVASIEYFKGYNIFPYHSDPGYGIAGFIHESGLLTEEEIKSFKDKGYDISRWDHYFKKAKSKVIPHYTSVFKS